MTPNPTISKRFLQDLDRVKAGLEPPLEIARFIRDLDEVQKGLSFETNLGPPIPAGDLAFLSTRLDEVRRDTLRKLGGRNWLMKLPAHDPLRSLVSLFAALDLGLRETAHTRALAWLVDPKRSEHGFGDLLLRVFLKEIFQLSMEPELSEVMVESETVNGESRDRLDICIRGTWRLSGGSAQRWLVIVEAKITAGEGQDQCARYEKQSRRKIARAHRHALVFLTPDGRHSTTGSRRRWKRFSFTKLMALFRTQLPRLRRKPGFEFLRLYMTCVLKDICDLNCGGLREQHDIYGLNEYLTFKGNQRN